jgi:hypothetical protein
MHDVAWHGKLARKSWGLGIPFGGRAGFTVACMMIKDVL